MFTGSTKNPPPKSPQPERLDEVYAALRRGLQSYLQVHQLELDSLGQQIRESKRNGRLGFLYELDKQVKAIERFMRRLEFHLSKVEELYDAYCMQRRLRDGASKMVAAFNSASGSKEARESLSEANRGYREYTEHMCSLESELEGQMGEFHIKMKGLAGFARLCAGDQYEVLMRAGRQRWRLRGRVESSGRQVWDSEDYVFLPLITEMLSIKVTELKSLANHVVVGSVSCETLDLFCPLPQTVAVDINDLGTVKLNLEVTWSPFDKDDQTGSSSTVSKRFLSNQSPPDTPSMREQVFYSLLKRQGELENGTVWSNSSESSDDSSSPALGHHAHRMTATPSLKTTPTIQISFNPRQSSASTPSLSSNQEEDENDAAEGLDEAVPNGHLQSSESLSHIDDTSSVDSTMTDMPLGQSPGSSKIPEFLGQSDPEASGSTQSHTEASCSGQKSEAWDLPESDTSRGVSVEPEILVSQAQTSVLQAQSPGAGVEAGPTDSALGEGLREEKASPMDNQTHQSNQSQDMAQGLRVPVETLKGRSHSRSSSFSLDIENALESFDFLNCSDLMSEEGEDEEDGEEEEQEEEADEMEEELDKEKEEADKEKKEADKEKEEGDEEKEEEGHEKEKEELREQLKKEEEKDEEELKKEEKVEEEKMEEEKMEEEEEEESTDYDEKPPPPRPISFQDSEEEEEEEIEIFVEAPEGFRNCDCGPPDEDCSSEPQESIEELALWQEEEKEEWGEEEQEKEKEEQDKEEKKEGNDKEKQQVDEKDKEEEPKSLEEGDTPREVNKEERVEKEEKEEEKEEITETTLSKKEQGEETSHNDEAPPSSPNHLANTLL